MDFEQSERYFVVMPAAGIGQRMGEKTPKQYLEIDGQTLIERSLQVFINATEIQRVVVALHPQDQHWANLDIARNHKIDTVIGGATRAQSVLSGINNLMGTHHAKPKDWVLVHDAVRPCFNSIASLISKTKQHPVGGLLGLPISDTVKFVEDNHVDHTVPRQQLWRAQTPQIFRIGLLHDCLTRALKAGVSITDEASAIEWGGYKPLMIQGASSNIKITTPDDLAFARAWCAQRQKETVCSE